MHFILPKRVCVCIKKSSNLQALHLSINLSKKQKRIKDTTLTIETQLCNIIVTKNTSDKLKEKQNNKKTIVMHLYSVYQNQNNNLKDKNS